MFPHHDAGLEPGKVRVFGARCRMAEWWETFFNTEYVRLWERAEAPGQSEREGAGLWAILNLTEGSRVLDAPCGYGRIARTLAERGASVLGIDQSADLIAAAEQRRGGIPSSRLRYVRHDLRQPLPESGFDAAVNIFSSLGCGTEAEDQAMLSTLRNALRPGGAVFVELTHRDRVAVALSQNSRVGHRLPDGTLLVEETQLDAVTGRINPTWYWSGSGGSGQKSASLRVYSVTELVKLLEFVGLRVQSLHDGSSTEKFIPMGRMMSSQIGVLAIRD
jgi:SAM-dependent methyltransferase